MSSMWPTSTESRGDIQRFSVGQDTLPDSRAQELRRHHIHASTVEQLRELAFDRDEAQAGYVAGKELDQDIHVAVRLGRDDSPSCWHPRVANVGGARRGRRAPLRPGGHVCGRSSRASATLDWRKRLRGQLGIPESARRRLDADGQHGERDDRLQGEASQRCPATGCPDACHRTHVTHAVQLRRSPEQDASPPVAFNTNLA